jgi:hypothetical protein
VLQLALQLALKLVLQLALKLVLQLALKLVLQLTQQLVLPHLPLAIQLQKIVDMIRGKDTPSLGYLLSGFSKFSTRLTMGEIEDIPSNG